MVAYLFVFVCNYYCDSVPVINEAQARQALLEEVGRHCCWGKAPAEKMTFTALTTSSAFHVSVVSTACPFVDLNNDVYVITIIHTGLCFTVHTRNIYRGPINQMGL